MYDKDVIIHLIYYLINANYNSVVFTDFYFIQFYFEIVSNLGKTLHL